MKKRKIAGMTVLLSALLCGALTVGAAETESAKYQLGDQVENFVLTTFSGEEVSLDELLEENSVVVLDFFASWSETLTYNSTQFAAMGTELDGVTTLEITSDLWDDPETAEETWQNVQDGIPGAMEAVEAGTLIGGVGSDEVTARFDHYVYPVTYLIDRNHTICFVGEGVGDLEAFRKQIEDVYTADDYSESVILEELPELKKEIPEAEDPQELSNVLTDGAMEVSIETEDTALSMTEVWPFLFNEEKTAVEPSNKGDEEIGSESYMTMLFEAEAGDLIALEYQMDSKGSLSNRFSVGVDGTQEDLISTTTEDWETAYVRVKDSGAHELELRYIAGVGAKEVGSFALRHIGLVTGEEAEAWTDPLADLPRNLPEKEGLVELMSTEGAKKLKINGSTGEESHAQVWLLEGAETVKVHIQVGEAFNLHTTVLSVMGEDSAELYALSDLERDENGYYAEVPMLSESTSVLLYSSTESTENVPSWIRVYTKKGAPLRELKQQMSGMGIDLTVLSDLELQAVTELYCYEDDTPIFTDADEIRKELGAAGGQAPAEEAEEEKIPELAVYTLHIQSELGKPVEGAVTQWIDETGMLQNAISDENGDAKMIGEAGDYTVHILSLPSKFRAVTENLSVAKDETEQTLTLYYR